MTLPFIVQQSAGEPTTPTPYPDGLVIHHADGSIAYPDAFTGERVVQLGEKWYHAFGFVDDPDWGMSFRGLDLFDGWVYGDFELIVGALLLVTWLALPALPWVNPPRYRAFLGWSAWITLGTASLFLLTSDYELEFLELSFAVVPAGLLFWWTSSTAKSWPARSLRIGTAAILLLYPWLPLSMFVSAGYADEAIWSSACLATMLPLALSQRRDLMDGKRGYMVACVPVLFFFTNLAADSYGRGFLSPWGSHAIPMAIAVLLLLLPRTNPARPAIA